MQTNNPHFLKNLSLKHLCFREEVCTNCGRVVRRNPDAHAELLPVAGVPGQVPLHQVQPVGAHCGSAAAEAAQQGTWAPLTCSSVVCISLETSKTWVCLQISVCWELVSACVWDRGDCFYLFFLFFFFFVEEVTCLFFVLPFFFSLYQVKMKGIWMNLWLYLWTRFLYKRK